MIEDQSQIDSRRTERAIGIDPVMLDFLNNVSVSGSPFIFAVTPDATRNVRSRISARPIAMPTTDMQERTIPVGPLGSTRILVVRPLGVKVRLPVVMYFHGADWVLGALDTHRRLVRDIAYGARTVVVLVDYHRSLEGHYPIAFEEAYEVTKYVAENVDEFNVDPTRLAIAGDGVGANMVGAVSLFAKERDGPSIRCQLLFYAVTDGKDVECPHNEFANGPWLTRYIMKWYWPLQASLEQLEDQLPVLIIADQHDLLLDDVEVDSRKIMLPGVTVTAVRSLEDARDSIMLGGLSDTPATRGAIALANTMLRQELANRRQASVGVPWRRRNGMHEMANTLSFKHCAKMPSLPGLRVDVAIDLQAQGKRGCWSVRGASFVAIHDPFDRVTSTGANYANVPAESPSALCIALGALLPAPAPATALLLKPGLRGGVNRLTLLRAIAEVLQAFSVSLRVEIYQAEEFDAVEKSNIFSVALHSVDQLLWLVESQIKPIAPIRRMN